MMTIMDSGLVSNTQEALYATLPSAPPTLRPSHQPDPESPSADATEPYRAGYRGLVRMHEPDVGPFYGGGMIWSMGLIGLLLAPESWIGADPIRISHILPATIAEVEANKEQYGYLLKSFQVYGQKVPIRIFSPKKQEDKPGRLRDGLHRIAICSLLGWESMIVSTTMGERSMWMDWEISVDGEAYHRLWAKRLGLDAWAQ